MKALQIHVLLFASHRDALGQSNLDLVLPEGSTITDVMHVLSQRSPNLARLLPGARAAINQEYCAATAPLKDGDELAFIPPVSGG